MVDQTIRNLNVPEFLWYQRRYHERLPKAAESKKYIYGVHEFTPLLVPSLLAWYDPADTETCFQERSGAISTTRAGDGDPVGTILDKSGNGHHLTAVSDGQRPIRRLSAGGLWYLDFDEVDDHMNRGGISISGSGFTTVTAWVRTVSTAEGWVLRVLSTSGGVVRFGEQAQSPPSTARTVVFDDGPNFISRSTGAGTADSLQIQSNRYDNSSGNWDVSLKPDGYSDSGTFGSPGLQALNDIVFNLSLDAGGGPPSIDFYGAIILDGAPSDDDLSALQQWLAKRAGLTI